MKSLELGFSLGLTALGLTLLILSSALSSIFKEKIGIKSDILFKKSFKIRINWQRMSKFMKLSPELAEKLCRLMVVKELCKS